MATLDERLNKKEKKPLELKDRIASSSTEMQFTDTEPEAVVAEIEQPKSLVPTPVQAKDRTKAKTVINSIVTEIPNPDDKRSVTDIVKAANEKIAAGIGEIDSKYKSEIEDIAKQLDEQKARLKSERDRADWLKLASMLTNNLVQLGAASYGKRHGINLAGVPVKAADIDSFVAGRIQDVKDAMKALQTRRTGIEQKKAGEKQAITERERELAALEAGELSKEKEREFRAEEAEKARRFKEEQTKAKQSLDITPAQKKVDENFAKNYIDWIAGKESDARKNINQLENVIVGLSKTDTATGPVIGSLPKFLRNIVTPDGASLQDQVEEVIQRNLTSILGAQFTEKEGKRLIERAYNPQLEEEENMKRVARLLNQMKDAYQSNQRAKDYYENNKTLSGYKGKVYRSVDDFDILSPENKSSTAPAEPQTVRVVSPDGQIGTIPAANKEAALQAGYKLAE